MPTWLLNPNVLRYIGVAIGVIAFSLGIYVKGRHDVQVKFDAYKAEVAAAAKYQEEHNRQVIEQRDLFNKGVVDGYKAKLAAANAYVNGLRYDGSASKLSSPGNTAAGTDGSAENNIPAAPILASDCAATTVQLIQLQRWVEGQVSIK